MTPHEATPGTPAVDDELRRLLGDELLTTAQIVDRLGVRRDTVYRWRTVGYHGHKLPSIAFGRVLKFAPDDVFAFVLRMSGRPQEATPRRQHEQRRRTGSSPEAIAHLASLGIYEA